MTGTTKTCLVAVALFATLITGGYIWHQADHAAAARAEWLNDLVSAEDEMARVSISARGFLNRDVLISVYTLGKEVRTAEDYWVERIAHGNLVAAFYWQGFRRISASESNTISRAIVIAPPQPSIMQKEESGEPLACQLLIKH
jgi:hypothetical protein